MQYALLIYNDESTMRTSGPEREAIFKAYNEFTQSIISSGHMRAGEALQPTTTATTVRVRDGKTLTTDGPYAETKEQLGGFYLIDAKDLDDATKVAAGIPGARHGTIEVRPILEMPPGYPRPKRA